jgi:hypothetical protein
MTDVNGLGAGFGGTLAAPIWHDFMLPASDGYCGDFPAPAVPWTGTAFFGHYSTAAAVTTTTTTTTTTPTTTTTTPGTTTPGTTTPGPNPAPTGTSNNGGVGL